MSYPWQNEIWQRVQQARNSDHLHHALLFSGEEGCGNSEFVQALAKSLLCLSPTRGGYACKQCRSCQTFQAGSHPDFKQISLLEDKQAILIEQIRELNYFLGLSRSCSPRRLAVIAPAERMNINAANSLLKSLEEPAPDTHILLLTAHPAALLPTIRSRCQEMRLPLPAHDEALQWLQEHPLQHPEAVLLDIARGRPLAAAELDKSDRLGQRTEWLRDILQILQGKGNIGEVSLHWEKVDKSLLLDWQLDFLYRIGKQRIVQSETLLEDELRTLAKLLKEKDIFSIYEKLLELKKLAAHPLNSRLYVESMLMLWRARS